MAVASLIVGASILILIHINSSSNDGFRYSINSNYIGYKISRIASTGSVRIIIISSNPDLQLVHSLRGFYAKVDVLRITKQSKDAVLQKIAKYIRSASRGSTIFVVDVREASSRAGKLNLMKSVVKYIVFKLNTPIVLIGSPSDVKTMMRGTSSAYGVPSYIVTGKNKGNLRFIKIRLLVYGYLPPITIGYSVDVADVVYNSSKSGDIALAIRDVVGRMLNYLRTLKSRPLFEFTLPSQETKLLTQLDAKLDASPYGKINARDAVYQVLDDGNPTYDWYIYRFIDQIVPGIQIWNNGWRNNKLIQALDADYDDPTGFLSYYSPSTYVGSETTTWTVELGITGGKDKDGVSIGGSLTIGYSWSYSKPDVEIIDRSDYSLELAKWENRINKDKAVGTSTVQLEPGAIIRFPEEGVHHFRTSYVGQWAEKHCLILGYLCSWSYSDYMGLVVDWTIEPPS